MSSGDARSSSSPLAKSAAGSTPSSSQGAPLISLSVIDAPAQRLYAVSAFILVQAYKLLLLLLTLSGSDGSMQDAYREGPLAVFSAITTSATEPKDGLLALPQAALIDFVAIFGLYKLRVPRLTFPVAQWVVIFALLTGINYTIVTKAGWVGTLLGLALRGLGLLIPGMGTTIQKQLGISEQWVKVPNLIAPKSRILGQVSKLLVISPGSLTDSLPQRPAHNSHPPAQHSASVSIMGAQHIRPSLQVYWPVDTICDSASDVQQHPPTLAAVHAYTTRGRPRAADIQHHYI